MKGFAGRGTDRWTDGQMRGPAGWEDKPEVPSDFRSFGVPVTQERHFGNDLFSQMNPRVRGPLSPKTRHSVAVADNRELCRQTGRVLTLGPRRALIKSLNHLSGSSSPESPAYRVTKKTKPSCLKHAWCTQYLTLLRSSVNTSLPRSLVARTKL